MKEAELHHRHRSNDEYEQALQLRLRRRDIDQMVVATADPVKLHRRACVRSHFTGPKRVAATQSLGGIVGGCGGGGGGGAGERAFG